MNIMASVPITSWQIDGETMETMTDFIFLSAKITENDDCSHEIKRHLLLQIKGMTNLEHILKSRHYFTYWGPYSQSYGFSSSHVWMWELDNKKSWALKNWYLRTVVLEQTLESLLESKEIKTFNTKRYQPWIFIGRTMLKLNLLYFSHLMPRVDSLE